MDHKSEGNCSIPQNINILFRALQDFLTHEIEGKGITVRELMYLGALIEQDGISQDQLAQSFLIDKGAVARAVSLMEQKKLLTRRRDPEDSRRRIIELTDQGRAYADLIGMVQCNWQSMCLDGIDEEKYQIFTEVLCSMADKVRQKEEREGNSL